MSLGDWVKQNKLAAGGIAAGAGFLYLSRRGGAAGAGGGGTSNELSAGLLTPVAAGYDTSTDTASSEQAQAAADSAASAAEAAQQAADAATSVTRESDSSTESTISSWTQGLVDLQDAGVVPPFAAQPTASSVPVAQAAPAPTPAPAPAPAAPKPPPADPEAQYKPGVNGWSAPNAIVRKRFPNAISWRDGYSGGTNSNGTYMTAIINTPGHHNQYFHYYVSGRNKGEWVALN